MRNGTRKVGTYAGCELLPYVQFYFKHDRDYNPYSPPTICRLYGMNGPPLDDTRTKQLAEDAIDFMERLIPIEGDVLVDVLGDDCGYPVVRVMLPGRRNLTSMLIQANYVVATRPAPTYSLMQHIDNATKSHTISERHYILDCPICHDIEVSRREFNDRIIVKCHKCGWTAYEYPE